MFPLIHMAVVILIVVPPCLGQDLGEDVEGLTLTEVGPRSSLLTWDPVQTVPCETSAIYSVFRGANEDFTPSLSNRIASGLSKTSYNANEPVARKDYYYYVKFKLTTAACVPHSGAIAVYPMDLDQNFVIRVGYNTGVCTATSTSEITCNNSLPNFRAVIARQGNSEYLIGCDTNDYETGDWTCAPLSAGIYNIIVHSRTLTVLNSGMSKINTSTGKRIGEITPVFSVLARIQP